jgi:hypothetical protein
MSEMYALTLHQPWATLIADAEKQVENRSWAPPRVIWGSRIAIQRLWRLPPAVLERVLPQLGRRPGIGALAEVL